MSKKITKENLMSVFKKDTPSAEVEIIAPTKVDSTSFDEETVYITAQIKRGDGKYGEIVEQFDTDENVNIAATSCQPCSGKPENDRVEFLIRMTKGKGCYGRLMKKLDEETAISDIHAQAVGFELADKLEAKMNKNIDSSGKFY